MISQGDEVVAFGSCNRQTRSQSFWSDISKFHPTHFLWTGDAVYTKGRSLEKLSQAYHNLTSNEFYGNFSKGLIVDGIWDDHDYGINDAGKYIDNAQERKDEYVKFLTGSRDNDLRKPDGNGGLYHSTVIKIGDVLMKVIFLDTRSFRDDHWIRSLGEYPIKGSAVVASFIRGVYSTLGMGRQYAGDMLGSSQWAWLERTLKESTTEQVDVNVIVSSVQVLTSNAIFESWNHFPVEKKRLFTLLANADPKNVVFISGDVHLGEISEATYQRSDGSSGKWTEVTSSGLTHSCSDGFTGIACPIMTSLLSEHRRGHDSIHLDRNFGLIEAHRVVGSEDSWTVNFSVHALPSTETVLSHQFVVDKSVSENAPKAPIASVQYADFPQLPPIVMLVGAVIVVWLARVILFRRSNTNAIKKRNTKEN